MWKKKNKKTAVVLAGGGAKGIAHAGVLSFFEEQGYRPDMIVGTSMGAIIGGLWANGNSMEDIKNFYRDDFELKDYINLRIVSLFDFSLSKFLMGPEAFFRMSTSLGIDKPGKFEELFEELSGGACIEDLGTEFYCNAVDLRSSREYIFERGKLSVAMRASMSVPGLFIPVEKDGMLLVDGGVVDNLPVGIARDKGADRIVAVDVLDNHGVNKECKNGFDVIANALWVNSVRERRQKRDSVDLYIDAGGVGGFGDFDKFDKLFEHGYNTALKNVNRLEKIFK